MLCVTDHQAAKSIKTSEFMPFVVFIAAPAVEIQRNMHEYARLKGKTDKIRGVSRLQSQDCCCFQNSSVYRRWN